MKLIRVYKKIETAKIKPFLLIYGELSGQCANCEKMDIGLATEQCPACQANFLYVAFRSPNSHFPKILKLLEDRPSLSIIDYDDYKRSLGSSRVDDFFG